MSKHFAPPARKTPLKPSRIRRQPVKLVSLASMSTSTRGAGGSIGEVSGGATATIPVTRGSAVVSATTAPKE